MDKLWFKAKQYGWGWTPCTWQGWTVTVGYLVVLISISNFFESRPDGSLSWYLLSVLVATAALFGVCYKTGERPSWRWGKKK